MLQHWRKADCGAARPAPRQRHGQRASTASLEVVASSVPSPSPFKRTSGQTAGLAQEDTRRALQGPQRGGPRWADLRLGPASASLCRITDEINPVGRGAQSRPPTTTRPFRLLSQRRDGGELPGTPEAEAAPDRISNFRCRQNIHTCA